MRRPRRASAEGTESLLGPAYWEEKFARNLERDRRKHALLAEQGWRVRVVWEC